VPRTYRPPRSRTPELDVDAAAGHVRRDRDRAALARVLDDLALPLVLLRVQHVVVDALALEELREVLGRLDGDRAHEHGLSYLVALDDVVEDGVELRVGRLEDEVVLVETRDRLVRRNLDHVQVVDLDELLLLRLRRPGHPGELLVQAEVVLERDRRERDVLLADLHALLRLDRLVQPLAPAAPLHDAAGELVDDLDLALLDDVVDVALVQRLRLQRLHQVVHEDDVARVIEVLDPERALDLLDRPLRRGHRLELLVVEEVGTGELRLVLALRALARRGRALEVLDDARELVVGRGRRLRLAGDDQRRPRLVDEDRVHLVDDRVGVAPLDDALERDRHVVTEIVEPELRVRPVGDVARVCLAALGERHQVLDEAHRLPERLVHRARPLGVAPRKVVVHRHEVDATARERVQVERLHGDERLPLAGLHLGDVALVKRDPAHQLDVEEADADRPLECLANGGVRLEDQILERLPVLQALAELRGLPAQLVVRQRLELRLEGADVGGLIAEPLEASALAEAEDALELAEGLGRHGTRVAGRALGSRGRERPGAASGRGLVLRAGRGLLLGKLRRDRRLDRLALRRAARLVRALVPVPLDLSLELVDEAVDRGLVRLGALARDDVRPLRVDDRLGRVVVLDRRVVLPRQRHLDDGLVVQSLLELREPLLGVCPHRLVEGAVVGLHLEPHGAPFGVGSESTSLLSI
jgi:hypothetical protein